MRIGASFALSVVAAVGGAPARRQTCRFRRHEGIKAAVAKLMNATRQRRRAHTMRQARQLHSTFAAVVARLSSLTEAIEQSQASAQSAIEIVRAEGRLAYERLTLLSSTNASPLVKDLSISIPVGARVLVTGPNQAAGVALFRATAGLSPSGSGRIVRPGANKMGFLPQRPYLPPGTLRQVLDGAERADALSDDRLFTLLRELNFEQVVTQAGGLDSERDWRTLLSLREQQLLAVIHIVLAAPQFVLLDRVGAVLSSDEVQRIFQLLSNSSMTTINIGAADEPRENYDAILECREDGSWAWTTDSQPEKSNGMGSP